MTVKLCIFTAVVNNLASDLYFSEAKNDSFSVHFINNQVVDLPTFLRTFVLFENSQLQTFLQQS